MLCDTWLVHDPLLLSICRISQLSTAEPGQPRAEASFVWTADTRLGVAVRVPSLSTRTWAHAYPKVVVGWWVPHVCSHDPAFKKIAVVHGERERGVFARSRDEAHSPVVTTVFDHLEDPVRKFSDEAYTSTSK